VGFLDIQCHRACTTDADCPGGGSLCTIDVGGVSPPLRVCNPSCNPITGSGCTASSCLVTQEPAGMRRFHSICVGPIGTGTLGASCTDQSDCATGHVCATTGTCEKYCRVGFSDCPTGYTCPADGAGTVNGVDYNLCSATP
jgi:hypothetical protein